VLSGKTAGGMIVGNLQEKGPITTSTFKSAFIVSHKKYFANPIIPLKEGIFSVNANQTKRLCAEGTWPK
jgi:hypothetical protein